MSDGIHLNADQAARLRAALRSGKGHLSDEDFINRAFDDGSEDDKTRIDLHLASCGPCQQELARIRSIATEMNTEERRVQIDRLWSGFVDAVRAPSLRAWVAPFWTIVLPVPGLVTRSGSISVRQSGEGVPIRVIAEGSTDDGRVRWRFTEETSGSLKGVIECSDVEPLRGASVWVNTEPQRAVAFAEFAGKLRAEFVISREEWRQISRRSLVRKIVSSNGEVITSDR